ncbi:MAG TPA: DUF1648 domain-containing protein [Thermoanaerobaculaceae bacterium]|nr:DUF1648 domain-containing protein [Thermoanaerobaculaceae bacterium]HPS77944.1 DUF1648 domain-containing protein [Thermoanaerobaculaceae bacterium]
MSATLLFVFMLSENVLIGGVYLLYPWIVRKGLLFGVYVGEEGFDAPAAHALTRRWYRAMVVTIVVGIALGSVLALFFASPLAMVVPVLLQVIAFTGLYLWAHAQACALAPVGPPPAAVAPLFATPPLSPLLPALTIAACVACGLFAVAHAWTSYGALPPRVPTHFGISGTPDAWRPKSIATVMLLPVMVLVLAVGLGGTAWLTANAKRALRRSDQGASLAAQLRFRRAMTRFLCGVALFTTLMLTVLSVSAIEVGLGHAATLGRWQMVLTAVMMAYAIGGTVYLAIRYGQGGSRLERAGAATPLTNGLADNRYWVLGMFYVNRDDPSLLVERRFGLGYTINFGNPRAVLLAVAFLGAVLALVLLAAATH